MKQQQDIDKIVAAIELQKELLPKFKKWSEAKKWYQKVFLIISVVFGDLKKVISFARSIPEIAFEFADIDPAEAEQIYELIAEQFDGYAEDVKVAVKDIVIGVGYLNQGIPKLIVATKK